jgi:RND family efflux transporter MFP subunit
MAEGVDVAAVTVSRGEMMKRAGWIFGTALALALAGAGCGDSPASQNSTAASVPTAKTAPASPAEGSDSQEILTVLSVEHQVDVLAQRDGPVTEIIKDEGSRVRKGEILAQLDEQSLESEAEKIQADLRVTQNDVKYLDAELKAKRANLRRQQELRQYGLSSDADLEQSEFQAKGAEYDLDSQRSKVERAQAELRTTQLELAKMKIRAPFDGVVVRRYIRQGQNVVKDDKCFRISQLSTLRVQFQIPESSGHHPRLGDEVKVSLSDEHPGVYTARVTSVSPTVDAASGTYDVTARLLGLDLSDLRPGMAARVVWPGTSSSPKH